MTVSKDTNLIIELSVPDARLAAIRHASSATAQAQQGIAEEGEDMSMIGDGSGSSYAPISLCVMKGPAPSTADYGRVWHGDKEGAVIGETPPVKRRGVGLSIQLTADRAYCVVPCCMKDVHSPFVLRLQSEVSFTLKQAQPATVSQLNGLWDGGSAGGPPKGFSKSWSLNPQYWLTIRPPPTGAALARVRFHLEGKTPTAEQAASSTAKPIAPPSGSGVQAVRGAITHKSTELRPPDVGLTLYRGDMR